MAGPVCRMDFTIYEVCGEDTLSVSELARILEVFAKKWVFQLEMGEESKARHYQGRMSLKVKSRCDTIANKIRKEYLNSKWCIHLSATSNANKDNDFYVTKEDTRIDGPWDDIKWNNEKPAYIPRQVREIIETQPWRPFQQSILDSINVWDTRHANILICPKGNIGKSVLVQYMDIMKMSKMVPFIKDYEGLLRMVYDTRAGNRTKWKGYCIDMPRAIKKEKLGQIYAAIETIKGGYCWDDRYEFKDEHFDCPVIWVMTNREPELDLLSLDRWKIWTVDEEYNLVPWAAQNGTEGEAIKLDIKGPPEWISTVRKPKIVVKKKDAT